MMKQRGKVAFYHCGRGFGFISPDSGAPDVFYHRRHILGGRGFLIENERVAFDTKPDKRPGKPDRLEAFNIEVVTE